MALLDNVIFNTQYRPCFLNKYSAIYIKIALLILTIVSRFIHIFLIITMLTINTILLIYISAGKFLLKILFIWIALSSVIISIDYLFSTLTISVLLNLIYGFTTFTSLSLFYLTTPPRHIERFLGFNIFTLTYLFLNYYVEQIVNLINILRARGWNPVVNIFKYKYFLRIVAVFLVTRINECMDVLKARGIEE